MARRRRQSRARKKNKRPASMAGARAVNEGQLWQARAAVARRAVEFWNTFLILRMGPANDQPLDAAAIDRWIAIVRAVSWVESRHGTATNNQGTRDPMQCGHPADAWWQELIVPGNPEQDRFITGPGGSNFFAGDLPAAAEVRANFPARARVTALADETKGHNDAGFSEFTSYFWGAPILIHKTNSGAGVQTFKCGDLSRDRLIDGAVDYNGGGIDPAEYQKRIVDALALFGGLTAAPKLRATAARSEGGSPIASVAQAVSALLTEASARSDLAVIDQASLKLAVGRDGAVLPPGRRDGRSTVTLRVSGKRLPRRPTGASADPELLGLVEDTLQACAGGDVAADIEIPIELSWVGGALTLLPAPPTDSPDYVLHLACRGVEAATAPKTIGRPAVSAAAAACLDEVSATEVVVEALAPKPFEPGKTLGRTYLSPNERAAFRTRVRDRVVAKGCAIGLDRIPNGEGTKQAEVRDAVARHAH